MTSKPLTRTDLHPTHDTRMSVDDAQQRSRDKLARIALDSMADFVGLLDAKGAVLAINRAALDAAGIELADVEGKLLWTTPWWQLSEGISQIRQTITEETEPDSAATVECIVTA